MLSRRQAVKAIGLAGGALIAERTGVAQTPQAPPSTITIPPRDFGPNAPPTTYFTDPDVLVVDPIFGGYVQANSAIKRLWTGALWAEGPAWSGQGRYLVWSDIPNNRQLRWLEDDDRVTVFRSPSNNSNGNTFDFSGRQVSCEHLTRRVVRYEHDGSTTVLAESYNGKRLNSPNDVAAHPDGSYWFTDPPYGRSLYEGRPEKRELPTSVYRADGKGGVTLVVTEEQVPDPNGIAFSPDEKILYVNGGTKITAYDVAADDTIANPRVLIDTGGDRTTPGNTDGMKVDRSGNIYCSGPGGIWIISPQGKHLGTIVTPERVANLAFGDADSGTLYMVGGRSLWRIRVNIAGIRPVTKEKR